MSGSTKSASEKTVNEKSQKEVIKDVPDKTTKDKKTIEDGLDGAPIAQDASNTKLPTYTSQNPMQMKFRKNNLFIDVEKANVSKD